MFMNTVYKIVMGLARCLFSCFSVPKDLKRASKFRKFVRGQQCVLDEIKAEFHPDAAQPIIWFHASSLGEYGIARPIIRALREQKHYRIVLTFFSSTGYEALKGHSSDVDYVFYLPWDSSDNVTFFLDYVRPERAVFMVSEFWLNYLYALKARAIPTFLVSSVVNRQSTLFKWYAYPFRKALSCFTHISVLNQDSLHCLQQLGYQRAVKTDDPLFDNVLVVAQETWSDPILERFKGDSNLFIAGSIHDDDDVKLVTSLIKQHPDIRFVIVPHEISDKHIDSLCVAIDAKLCRYSAADCKSDLLSYQCMVVDKLGILAKLYRYGTWAYIGGGFTPYLHNLTEATVYGLPVAFGPVIHRKAIAQEIVEKGIGVIVKDEKDILQWFDCLKNDTELLHKIQKKARSYTQNKAGGTQLVLSMILQNEV